MTSFRLVLRTQKRRADGTCPILLRITEQRKPRFVSTGIAVADADWNDKKQEVRRSHNLASAYNHRLQTFVNDAQAVALDAQNAKRGGSPALAAIAQLKGGPTTDAYAFALDVAERLRVQGRFSGWKRTKVVVQKLKEFRRGQPLNLEDIDGAFLSRFEQHLRTAHGNGSSTISKDFQIFHRIIKEAILAKLVEARNDPFLGYRIPGGKRSEKTRLRWEQIQTLEALSLPPGSPLALARDAFLFSFYCAGIRFGDLCQLRRKNIEGGRLRYQMAKTGKSRSIKMRPQAEAILARYHSANAGRDDLLFPILDAGRDYADPIYVRRCIGSKNVVVNKNLKRLAERAGIEEHVSFHVSRHSFADFARRQGVSLYNIRDMLGHHSLKVTERYLEDFDQGSMDTAYERMFGVEGETTTLPADL